MNNGPRNLDTKLKRELNRLIHRLGLTELLEVKWLPGGKAELSGEVTDRTIYIYDKDPDRALKTLRHEVIEFYLVKQHEEDYVAMINSLMDAFNRIRRRKREELVERLSSII